MDIRRCSKEELDAINERMRAWNEIAYENRWKMSRFCVGSMMETRVVPRLR
jgi:hypothetical protein